MKTKKDKINNTDYSKALLRARDTLGSFKAISDICNLRQDRSVRKWLIAGRPPRTEYTGETDYASLIESATGGAVKASELKPDLRASSQ